MLSSREEWGLSIFKSVDAEIFSIEAIHLAGLTANKAGQSGEGGLMGLPCYLGHDILIVLSQVDASTSKGQFRRRTLMWTKINGIYKSTRTSCPPTRYMTFVRNILDVLSLLSAMPEVSDRTMERVPKFWVATRYPGGDCNKRWRKEAQGGHTSIGFPIWRVSSILTAVWSKKAQ